MDTLNILENKLLTQQILNNLIFNLKTKYNNILYDLRLECREVKSCKNNTLDECGYISLIFIGIKKSQRQKGYGSIILSEVIKVADTYNVPIKLWVTNVFGVELNILIPFYQRHGFTLIKKKKPSSENIMWYYPNKL